MRDGKTIAEGPSEGIRSVWNVLAGDYGVAGDGGALMQDKISCVELTRFSFDVSGLGLPEHGAAGVGNVIARKGSSLTMRRWAI